MRDKIFGILIALIIVFAAGYAVWGVGYQGEKYEELEPGQAQAEKVIRVGKSFKIILPKSDNKEQVWILTDENPRLELVGVDRTGQSEVWSFRAVRTGNAPLEFALIIADRGLWPSDERKVVNVEVR